MQKWVAPPYRQLFNATVLPTDKPVVIVHNKYAKEWDEPSPVNYIDVKTLMSLFELLKCQYKIVYIRPDPVRHSLPGFSADHNTAFKFDDFEEIRLWYPEVVIFQVQTYWHAMQCVQCLRFIAPVHGTISTVLAFLHMLAPTPTAFKSSPCICMTCSGLRRHPAQIMWQHHLNTRTP